MKGNIRFLAALCAVAIPVTVTFVYILITRHRKNKRKGSNDPKPFYTVVQDNSSNVSIDSYATNHNSLTSLGLDQPMVLVQNGTLIYPFQRSFEP